METRHGSERVKDNRVYGRPAASSDLTPRRLTGPSLKRIPASASLSLPFHHSLFDSPLKTKD
ncbi:hypothetical protein E2C01_084258 [Portunus trituberculatus]|uniref:Uncharacterized protein n=1 Tax=Portunus trituberculatus TaxID=210409 RepID=A0A5B7J8R8_PORTR|nr:hypothetical protein [Portunus trituberculatus]